MNISIDANTASPTALRLAAAILTFIAGFKENPQSAGQCPILPPSALTPTSAPTVFTPPVVPPAPPAPPAPPLASENTGAPQGEAPDQSTGEAEASPFLIDSTCEKWNPEIHTANQSKNSDGTWRRKRTSPKGEAPATPKTVELPKSPQIPPPPPPPPMVVEPAASAPTVPVSQYPATTVPPVPPVSTTTSPLAELGGDSFSSLVKYATNLVGAKKITTAALMEACLEVKDANGQGIPDIHACSKPENAALIPLVAASISARLAK